MSPYLSQIRYPASAPHLSPIGGWHRRGGANWESGTVGSIRSWSVHDVCRQRQKARRRTYSSTCVSSPGNPAPTGYCPPAGPKALRQEVDRRRLDLRQEFIYERAELRSVLLKSKTAPIVQKRKPVIKLPRAGSLTWDLDLTHCNCSYPFKCEGSCELLIHVSDVLILVFKILNFEFLLYSA
jgi:hypothetical protein